MDFKDQIAQLASRVEKMLPQIQTEEATKNALVMPFIQIMGYDVFNPFEVNPEYIADLGIKKGEKVDYAIMKDGDPTILIECKHHLENLDPHNSQLFRYFHTTKAKFGLLTNGLVYRFYTDLVEKNKMDSTPFFEFKLTEIKDAEIAELKKFHKSYFDVENITNTASELKYLNELKSLLHKEIADPSDGFVTFFTKQVYPKVITAKVKEQFAPIIKRSFNQLISDAISERLKSALNQEKDKDAAETIKTDENIPAVPESGIIIQKRRLKGFSSLNLCSGKLSILKGLLTETHFPILLFYWIIITVRQYAGYISTQRNIWLYWTRIRKKSNTNYNLLMTCINTQVF
ncbi:type I restriction endonuclease [Pedobacter sp. NJ-S-72]